MTRHTTADFWDCYARFARHWAVRAANRTADNTFEDGRGSSMGDEIFSLEEHRRRREENAALVRCARCGKMILASAVRCPECRIHFKGAAQDYLHPTERPQERRLPWWVVALAALLVLALALGALGWR